jgi:2-keto-4-pentenoate hydratase/2-oxohepta-3-ene-1,7-dioic acid hydratase in catechol pathway
MRQCGVKFERRLTFKPPKWLRDGDIVEVEIENIGILKNKVASEKPADHKT